MCVEKKSYFRELLWEFNVPYLVPGVFFCLKQVCYEKLTTRTLTDESMTPLLNKLVSNKL